MKFGYMRVSTMDQNLDRQEQQLVEFGCERIFFEKVTGAKRNRPELNQLLEYLRSGDTVVVTGVLPTKRGKHTLREFWEEKSRFSLPKESSAFSIIE